MDPTCCKNRSNKYGLGIEMLNKQQKLKEQENELLQIFILVEQNTYDSKKEALVRYAKWKGLKPNYYLLNNELKQHYAEFLKGNI